MNRQVHGEFIGTIYSPLRLAKPDPPDILMFCGLRMEIYLIRACPAMETL
jgi:hypothetical protein